LNNKIGTFNDYLAKVNIHCYLQIHLDELSKYVNTNLWSIQ
jgi:hypothetical protein